MEFDLTIPITWEGIINIVATIVAFGAVIVAIVANWYSNKSLKFSIKIQEQSKNVELYEKRLKLYNDIKLDKPIPEIEINLLFDKDISCHYKKMKSYRKKYISYIRDKLMAEDLAEKTICELGFDDNFSDTIDNFKRDMSQPDCPQNVFDDYEQYCKKYEVVFSVSGQKEDEKIYNYSSCEKNEQKYKELSDDTKKQLLDMIESFIKKSISPIKK